LGRNYHSERMAKEKVHKTQLATTSSRQPADSRGSLRSPGPFLTLVKLGTVRRLCFLLTCPASHVEALKFADGFANQIGGTRARRESLWQGQNSTRLRYGLQPSLLASPKVSITPCLKYVPLPLGLLPNSDGKANRRHFCSAIQI